MAKQSPRIKDPKLNAYRKSTVVPIELTETYLLSVGSALPSVGPFSWHARVLHFEVQGLVC
jgi:hypothetical protein